MLVVLLTGVAAAHQQGVSYSDVEVTDGRVRYDLTIANHDLRDVDADGDQAIRSDEVLAQYPALRRLLARSVGVAVGGAHEAAPSISRFARASSWPGLSSVARRQLARARSWSRRR